VLLHFAVDATLPQRVRSIWERIANEYAMKMDVFLLFEQVVGVKIAHSVQGFKTTPLDVIDLSLVYAQEVASG
jgi:hypothetical protein